MSDGKAGFARRLNEAFDRLEIPPKQHGRFTALARLFSVSPVAARDWCEGNSYPSVDKLLLIVDTLRCGADWLLFGRMAPTVAAEPGPSNPATLAAPDAALTWLEIAGDAMAPTLRPGDQVAFRPGEGAPLQDGLYALALDTLPAAGNFPATLPPPVLRRLARRLDGTLAVGCDNPHYGDWILFSQPGRDLLVGLEQPALRLRVLGRLCRHSTALT